MYYAYYALCNPQGVGASFNVPTPYGEVGRPTGGRGGEVNPRTFGRALGIEMPLVARAACIYTQGTDEKDPPPNSVGNFFCGIFIFLAGALFAHTPYGDPMPKKIL